MKVRMVGKPANVALTGVHTTSSAVADAVIVFVRTLAEVDAKAGPAMEAAREDRIAWIAYPKAGQLNTDLNRDLLWKHMLKKGVQAVRQVAIDEVWSALRFRPRK
ncbi:MAG TPA: hypothetical protein VFR66_16210 [Burkholderiales bacterium]|nr:hypothetical protein [Burkholderiales bacterium]